MTGFIYAIRCMDRVKIGHSIRPTERFSQIKAGCPFPVQFLGVIAGAQMDERKIHKELAEHHTHSEWFHLNRKEVFDFLETLQEFSPPIVFVEEPHTSPARELFQRIGWCSWGGALGLVCTDFVAIKAGRAVPKPDLAEAIQRDLGIPASAWLLSEAA